jgi:hypothetical protein
MSDMYGFFLKFNLKNIFKYYKNIKVDGCRAAGNLTCQNNGNCNEANGFCDCSHGFNGTTCSECMYSYYEYSKKNLILKYINISYWLQLWCKLDVYQ